jgi:hypothetical protein
MIKNISNDSLVYSIRDARRPASRSVRKVTVINVQV